MTTQFDVYAVYREGDEPQTVLTLTVPHGIPNLAVDQILMVDMTEDAVQRYALSGMTGYITHIQTTVDFENSSVWQYIDVVYYHDNEDHHTTE